MFTNNKTFLISDAYSITLANSWYFANCYIAMSYYLTALYRYIFDNHLANGAENSNILCVFKSFYFYLHIKE